MFQPEVCLEHVLTIMTVTSHGKGNWLRRLLAYYDHS